ncbi:MAG: hypothetical protein DRN26_00400 [Thermoplasmata archaeon]|nr:MAG: hypothetical protein DRN26_00400 [Thermoplasmata archaeon]
MKEFLRVALRNTVIKEALMILVGELISTYAKATIVVLERKINKLSPRELDVTTETGEKVKAELVD